MVYRKNAISCSVAQLGGGYAPERASAGKGRFCFAVSPPNMPTERSHEACETLHVILHESQESCTLLEMGTSPFLVNVR